MTETRQLSVRAGVVDPNRATAGFSRAQAEAGVFRNVDSPKILFHLAACILVLEMKKGHLRWKMTELVKKSGVSRALIYRYFGSDKQQTLKDAMKIFVEHFYGFEKSATPFTEMVGKARRYILEYPEAALFYQKTRMEDSELSKEFEKVEANFRKKLTRKFPHLSEERLSLAHACIHGLVTAPFLSAEESQRLCEAFAREFLN